MAADEDRGKLDKRKLGKNLLWLLAFAVLFFAIQGWQSRGAASGQAPALAGPSVEGERLDLSSYRGEPLLVHFWATWCGVCRAEEHNVRALAEGGRLLTVASASGEGEAIARYLRAQELSMPTIADPRGQLASAWGVRAFPTTFAVDGRGRIRAVSVGYTSELGMRARLFFAGW